MTWNLWWRFGPWEDRQPVILDTLRRVDADVIGLQEVYCVTDDDGPLGGDQAARLADDLGYHAARSLDTDGEPQAFGNAVLSRWPISRQRTISLPGSEGAPAVRSAVVVELAAPHGPQLVAVTHLDWQYGATSVRRRQLEAVCREVAADMRRLGEGAPGPLLMGDLNAVPDSVEVRRLTGLDEPYVDDLVWIDTWPSVEDRPGHTWERGNPHAADAGWPRRRLDYVFIGWPHPKPLGNPIAARLEGGVGEPSASEVGSDHWAVVVDLDGRRFEA